MWQPLSAFETTHKDPCDLVFPWSPLQAGELSLEEMLALYGYAASDSEKVACRVAADLPNMTLDKVRSNHQGAEGRPGGGGRVPVPPSHPP